MVRFVVPRIQNHKTKHMRSLGRQLLAATLLTTLGWTGQALAQGNCQNAAQFPGGVIPVTSLGNPQTVSTCIFLQEFTHFGGIQAGGTYVFTVTNNGYITVREGAIGGPVIAQGLSPLEVTPTTAADLFVHYNVNETCATAANCETSTVTLLLDCTQPSVSFGTFADCQTLEYFVSVNVTSLGDATDVDITNTGGVAATTGVAVGTYEIGPFTTLNGVTVTVVHNQDVLCSVTSPVLQNPLCAIPIVCGQPALEETYCYGPNDSQAWSYTASGSGTLRLRFLRGTIESNTFDRIRIYDGPDNLSPLVFSHTNAATWNLGPAGSAINNTINNYYGVEVFSNSGSLYMEMESDGSVQCTSTTTYDAWEWEVVCLDCTIPQATVTVEEDCDNNEFSIIVDVTSTGDASTVNIFYTVNGGDVEFFDGIGLGETVLGPFAINDIVDLTVEHETNTLCSIPFGEITDPGNCPNLITCGDPALQQSYCYGDNENTTWLYTAVGTGTLRLTFTGGSIQSSTFDQLAIYDGVDISAPVLWVHTATATQQLAGIEVTTNSGNLFMSMLSNATTSCASGAHTTWQWNVVCLDCNIPEVSYTVVDDCPNNQFNIPVNVASTGDGSVVNIVYTVNGGAPQTIAGVGVGETVVGPFTVNDVVNMTVQHESNPLCHVEFGNITDTDTCPNLIVCGAAPLIETYCYGPNDSQDWFYSAVGSGTLRLRFLRGTIESNTFDRIRIYDGSDNTGPLLFSHTNATTWNLGPVGSAINNTIANYYGVEVFSTTGEIYMEMESDGSVQCTSTTTYDPWEWEVVCLDCTIPQATVTVADDCENDAFNLVVDVASTGDANTVTLVYTVDGVEEVLEGVGTGETTIGPFPFDAIVTVVMEHESNELCNVSLGSFTDTGLCPNLIVCGEPALETTYCYGANENIAWVYEVVGSGTLRLTFLRGTIQSATFDQLRIYDGADATGTLLFEHNATVTANLGPVGSAINNTFTTFYGVQVFSTTGSLFMELVSNATTHCSSTTTYDPMEWEVVCLDCTLPVAFASVEQNCADSTFVVNVDVTSVGDGANVNIVYTENGGAATTVGGVNTGVTEIGPFAFGTIVNVTVEHETNSLCDVPLGNFTNPPICPVIVCGAQVIEETYCYGANENRAWSYQLPGTSGSLRMVFLRGTIESSTWDRLRIYDGQDNTGALLFSHTVFATYNLGPVGSAVNNAIADYHAIDVTSTTGGLYMELESDGVIHCDGSTTYDPFEWEVFCEGCQAPGISYNMVENCFDRTYITEVIVTDAPPAEGLSLTNLTTGETITANAVGVYEFGPYAQDAISAFEIVALDNPDCSYFSEEMTFPSADCVIRTCGFDNYEYCYGNNEDRWYTFQADASAPITIGFLQGQMLPGDFIVVYNGFNESAAVIYQGNNAGNLTGFAVNSQNPSNTITLRISSNASGSCADGQATIPYAGTCLRCRGHR